MPNKAILEEKMKKSTYQSERLGDEIRLQRKKKEMSQDDLAWELGKGRSWVSRLERGIILTSDRNLRRIEEVLNLPHMHLSQLRCEFIRDETIEQTAIDIKVDLINRGLSEKSMQIIARVTGAVADVLEEMED